MCSCHLINDLWSFVNFVDVALLGEKAAFNSLKIFLA